MPVIVVQLITYDDGSQERDERVVNAPRPGDDELRILVRKRGSAKRYGWSYAWDPPVLHTWKEYDEDSVTRKDRWYSFVEE